MYNNDHLTAIGGESNSNFGPGGLGYYLADTLNSDTSLGGSATLQNVLTNFYNKSFGPAATPMEDYFVMFNGTSADPNLSGPPARVTFNGNANLATSGASSIVASDKSILQEAFAYFDAADNDLTNAFNSGNNGTITTTQYAADQARVDQLRMYMGFLFDQYKLESDFNAEGYTPSNLPTQTSPYFNTLLNDLTNQVIWVDSLAFTEEVDTEAYSTWFNYGTDYSDLYAIWSNDPAGSNGLASGHGQGDTHGLLQDPSSTAYIDNNTNYLINNSPSQSLLNSTWTADEVVLVMPPAIPTGLGATPISDSQIDLQRLEPDNSDGVAATAYDIDRSTNAINGLMSRSPRSVAGRQATTTPV